MNTIYYFSATGNSLQAALDIAEGLGDTDVVSITQVGMNVQCGSDVIGFVFPTFAWGMPNMVHDFIASGSFNKDAYFFTVVTCGMAIGGTAGDVGILLREKGAKLSYGKKLRTVANYIAAYDAKTETRENILAKADNALAKIISDLAERKTCKIKDGPSFIRKLHNNFTANYKNADKDYNVSGACDGCGICASVCPAKNIEITFGRPSFRHNCEHCLACIHWCPRKAINYKDKTKKRNRYHHPKVKAGQLP